jgi:hypothetical protein
MSDEDRLLGFGGEPEVNACAAVAERKAEIFGRSRGEIAAALRNSHNPKERGELSSHFGHQGERAS